MTATSLWRRRGVRLGAAAAVLVVLVGAGVTAYAAGRGGSDRYRTAVATRGAVQQTLALSGTIAPEGRADLAFATAGTVASVTAKVGDPVGTGEVLARLGTAKLRDAVIAAQAEVAQAKAQLGTDEASLGTSGSSSGTPSSGPSGSTGVTGVQQALAAAQHACVSTSGGSVGVGSTDPSAAPSASASTSASTAPSGSSSGDSCAAALAAVQKALTALEGSGSVSSQAAISRPGGGTTGTTGTGDGTTGTVTAATLAKDEASIAEARSALVSARASLKGAVLTSPVAGTVAQVSVTSGSSATAGSTAVTVVAPGLTTVTISATSTQAAELKPGQTATVTPVGAGRSYAATVTRVGNVPATSSSGSGSTTYPVTVTLKRPDLGLLTGASAAVEVVIGAEQDVVTVPTSAVQDGTVEVLADGTVTPTRVTTGLVGGARTSITAGLSAGQTVVLADLSEALPTSDSTTSGFGGGGLGGAGLGGGLAVRIAVGGGSFAGFAGKG